MEDADQVQARGARLPVGCEQVFGTQLIARALRSGVGVLDAAPRR